MPNSEHPIDRLDGLFECAVNELQVQANYFEARADTDHPIPATAVYDALIEVAHKTGVIMQQYGQAYYGRYRKLLTTLAAFESIAPLLPEEVRTASLARIDHIRADYRTLFGLPLAEAPGD